MSLPPVWLLDVDGVINAARPGWGAKPRSGMASSMAVGWRMRWAPALVRRIRDVHTTGALEVRWCDAAKLAAAQAVLEGEGRPLVWTDDDAVPLSGPTYDELPAGGRALLIRPRAHRGLQPADLDAIEAFARDGCTA
jgi:hypothetical protein